MPNLAQAITQLRMSVFFIQEKPIVQLNEHSNAGDSRSLSMMPIQHDVKTALSFNMTIKPTFTGGGGTVGQNQGAQYLNHLNP